MFYEEKPLRLLVLALATPALPTPSAQVKTVILWEDSKEKRATFVCGITQHKSVKATLVITLHWMSSCYQPLQLCFIECARFINMLVKPISSSAKIRTDITFNWI